MVSAFQVSIEYCHDLVFLVKFLSKKLKYSEFVWFEEKQCDHSQHFSFIGQKLDQTHFPRGFQVSFWSKETRPLIEYLFYFGSLMQFLSLFLANYALTSPILVNLVSLEQFSNAYGFLLLVQGVSNLLGPPFAGFLYDVYKIWHYTFGLGGLFIVLSGLLLLILPCSRQVKLLRNQRLSQNKGQIKAKKDSKINFNGKSPAYIWKREQKVFHGPL